MDLARWERAFVVRKHTAAGLALATALASISTAAVAEVCPAPGTDCSSGTLQVVDFEAMTPGTSVEGLGAVHPDLAITSTLALSSSCTVGTAVGIEELNPTPLAAYGTGAGANGCLNGIRGYGDDPLCILNYEFTFSPGSTVSCFSIRLLDYGDFFPFGGVTHNVRIRGYTGLTIVDQELLTITGNTVSNGDACVANEGDPGNYILGVSGSGIDRVTVEFDSFADPNVGYDDIQFCLLRGAVPAVPTHWTQVKRVYGD